MDLITHIQSLSTRAMAVDYLTSSKYDYRTTNLSSPTTRDMELSGKLICFLSALLYDKYPAIIYHMQTKVKTSSVLWDQLS